MGYEKKTPDKCGFGGDMRTILHSDANSFYASVETLFDPALRGKPVAVCGSAADRHGIVLAKTEAAKRAGVKTGQANWQAKQLCPDLVMVEPHYERYMFFSRRLRDIYGRYTDQVEPYGMDECWLDVTGSGLCGERIADEIRLRVRQELGITVSVGVSFNKVLAKLGSDMKKPDAVTVLDQSNWKERVWPLPVGSLLYVGPSSQRRLRGRGILTSGDLAACSPSVLRRWFGVNGLMLGRFARGEDNARVMRADESMPVQSVGHGITCVEDLTDSAAVWRVLYELSQDVGHRLREARLCACGVEIGIRDNALFYLSGQTSLAMPTQSPLEMARAAFGLFRKKYPWPRPVRALVIRGIRLVPVPMEYQTDLFGWEARHMRMQCLDDCVDGLRGRFGMDALRPASLLGDLKMAQDHCDLVAMPGSLLRPAAR